MSESLRQVVWKCDRCGGDAQAIFGSFPSCKCGSTSFKAAQPPAPTAQPTSDDWKHLLPFGYAPGDYMMKCKGCAQTVSFVDKRALHCRPCAEKLHAAAQPVQQPGAEPDMRHPKIQALIGSKARCQIALMLVEQLIKDPDCELTSMDMEYWGPMHDRLKDALTKAAPAQRQPLSDEEIEAIWKAHVLPGFGERQRFYSPVVYARAIEAAHGIAAQKGEKP